MKKIHIILFIHTFGKHFKIMGWLKLINIVSINVTICDSYHIRWDRRHLVYLRNFEIKKEIQSYQKINQKQQNYPTVVHSQLIPIRFPPDLIYEDGNLAKKLAHPQQRWCRSLTCHFLSPNAFFHLSASSPWGCSWINNALEELYNTLPSGDLNSAKA